jgi:hypothetical protein
VVSGNLPPGLTLTAGGLVQGTPTEAVSRNLRIRVVDSSGANDARDFTMTVGPRIGTVTLTGLQSTVNPAQQMPFVLSLSVAHPFPLSGTLSLAFASFAAIPADDPAVQFSTGGRSVNFTFPANSTTAVFSSPLRLLTGTIAGTITITGAIQNGSSGLSLASVTVPSMAPRITSVEASRVSGGLRVLVAGYSTERRITEIEFGFDVRSSNGNSERVALTKAAEAEFRQWYQSTASLQFGSTFVFEQMFGVEGDSSSIEAVTVTLKNGQGSSTSSPTPF